ncbi:MAG: endonuclease NucS domain-containing protein [Pseudonocardiaceae bacterium]
MVEPDGMSQRPRHWAVKVKRKATIDAVEQLSRYVEFLNRFSGLIFRHCCWLVRC